MSEAIFLRPDEKDKSDTFYSVIVIDRFGHEGRMIMHAPDILFTYKGWEHMDVQHIYLQPVEWYKTGNQLPLRKRFRH